MKKYHVRDTAEEWPVGKPEIRPFSTPFSSVALTGTNERRNAMSTCIDCGNKTSDCPHCGMDGSICPECGPDQDSFCCLDAREAAGVEE